MQLSRNALATRITKREADMFVFVNRLASATVDNALVERLPDFAILQQSTWTEESSNNAHANFQFVNTRAVPPTVHFAGWGLLPHVRRFATALTVHSINAGKLAACDSVYQVAWLAPYIRLSI